MKYGAIRETARVHPNYSVEKMCQVMKVSRSGYYRRLGSGHSARKKQDEELQDKIRAIYHAQKGRYGSPRILIELQAQGVRCSRKRVAQLMRQMGLRARPKRRFVVTTDSNHTYSVAPNLLERQFTVDAPNRVWLADITYIRTYQGWLYLAAVMDLHSRKIVGWAMDDTMSASLPIAALNMAVRSRQPSQGLIHHSDRGSQYASSAYQKVLGQHQITCSMSRKGDCWDNAPMESFFSTLKIECVDGRIFLSKAQAKREIFEYIEIDYNRKRRHSSIGYMTPENYERLRKVA